MKISTEQVCLAVSGMRQTVQEIFERLQSGTFDKDGGITRPSYSEREDFAHDLMAEYAKASGFEVTRDASVNTYMTLPGADRSAPRIVIGSHLDSVRHGGNFDGAAGVVAGLVAMQVFRKLGVTPGFDITTMGVRAEESVWFQVSYLGSRGALGLLPEGALESPRIDTGRTAREHILERGGDPDALASGDAFLSRHNVRAFIEPHIEQAPQLVLENVPIAVCLGVPGLFMYATARVIGEYGHVGTPKQFRHDAAIAAADFAMALDHEWERQLAQGRQMAITFGRFHTDSASHGLTTIAGEFHFSLDIRAYQQDLLDHMDRQVEAIIARIEKERGVRFELGPKRSAKIGYVNDKMCASLQSCAEELGVRHISMYSPASHDAGAFSAAGIPTGMILIRNENGSHNPQEKMCVDDFLEAVKVLVAWLLKESVETGS